MASARSIPSEGDLLGGVRRRVRRDVPVPFWAQLSRILEQEIRDGRLAPGEDLPSEADLCSSHGVSRTAVRQALADLASRGLVQKHKGRRSSVSRTHTTHLVVQELRGFFDEVSSQGGRVETRILRLAIVPSPPDVARDLEISSEEEAVLLSRIRSVDGEPSVYVETYLPGRRFGSLVDVDLTNVSLYSVLFERFGVRPSSGERAIEAAVADAGLARHLEVRKGSPLLELWAVNRDETHTPFERFRAWYRGDGTRFELVIGS